MKLMPYFDKMIAKERIIFIERLESGTYKGMVSDGRETLVVISKGKSMDIKYLNDEGHYDCLEYNKLGNWQCEWIENKRGVMINYANV